MAGARKTARLGFEALRIEGGLIAPDMVADIAGLRAHGQLDVDYAVPPGLRLRDEIARFWRIGGALWARFDRARKAPGAQPVSESFVRDLLTQVFGFSGLAQATDGSGVTFEALNGRVPIAVAPAADGLDKGLARFAGAGRRRSAMLAAQERLNADDRALWGLATDGLTLRLLRDNASLTRPAYIEADLARMFGAGLYSDFFALWLLIHQSRFGEEAASASESPLERWREAGREAGARARERIRSGVEAALAALGEGFIAHPANEALRAALAEGRLTPQALFEELLRLVYRLIFLFTTEDRGLLHAPGATAAAKNLYADGYSLARLRALAARRTARDHHHDLFEGLKILFRALWASEKTLGLPALGGLFRPDQLERLGTARIANRDLLEAVFRLAWIVEDKALVRVNWRDMETEELGSVYEALLELAPRIDIEERTFAFAEDAEATGNARKTSASYYTPDGLVGLLLDLALDPVIERAVAENPGSEEKALLELTVVDPACGSGHFLLSAGRRIGTRLAQVRTNGSPTLEDWRRAVREVTRACLFGVDRNPMAVELCRTALWIESVEPGKPLTFLDAHIQCGDSLIGVFDLAAIARGLPDAAYKPLAGDDKAVASALRKDNAEQRKRPKERNLFAALPADFAERSRALDELGEDDLAQVEVKARAFSALRKDAAWWNAKIACDLYIAAFFRPKQRRGGALAASLAADDVPTTADIWSALEGRPPQGRLTAKAIDTAEEIRAFHWPLAFPQVFAKGGFDCFLGNPPWDTMSPDAKEFFSPMDPAVRFMSPRDQEERIGELRSLPGVDEAWNDYCRYLYRAANFMKDSGRYRLFATGNLGKGDFNVYRMFVELALGGARPTGRAAQFVPENLYNGANAAAIRAHLFHNTELEELVAFENTKRVWFDIHSAQKFCVYVARPGGRTEEFAAAFGVNSREKLDALASGFPIRYPVSLVREFSPDALAIAEVAHPADIEVSRKIYARFPKFGGEAPGLARRIYMRELDMGNDREDFGDDPDGLPVFEGRMVEAFDYRAKGYVSGRGRSAVWAELAFGTPGKVITPQWRVPQESLPDKALERIGRYRLGFCDVGGATNARFLMSAIIPPDVICGHSVPTILFEPPSDILMLFWIAIANSFVLDFVARKKAALHMSYTIMDSLPLPRRLEGTRTESAIAARALKLAADGPEMERFWRSSAPKVSIEPNDAVPADDAETRMRLRAELDVIIARDVFGLTRDEMLYVLEPADILGPDCGFETFGALKRAEEREFGSFVSRDRILAAWDTLSAPA